MVKCDDAAACYLLVIKAIIAPNESNSSQNYK
jgi:hypothetical protein